MNFINAFKSEWLKTRRSAASWLVVIGGFFIPAINLLIQFSKPADLPQFYKMPDFWQLVFNQCWQSMALFLLPMGVILATSLITQLEYRNNTWKLIHTLPQRFSITFCAKLAVILTMMLEFFILFNVGIYLNGIIPPLFLSAVDFPVQAFPFLHFVKINAMFYLDCLPVIAFQFLISLRFKNFMVPIGVGLAMIVATVFCISWKYGYIVPYTYTSFYYLNELGKAKSIPGINIHMLASAYFVVFTAASFILYRTRKEIG